MIAKIEARQPDSYLERTWRKMSGKKKTKAEEKAAKDAKEQKAVKAGEGDLGTVEAYHGLRVEKENDGIIR